MICQNPVVVVWFASGNNAIRKRSKEIKRNFRLTLGRKPPTQSSVHISHAVAASEQDLATAPRHTSKKGYIHHPHTHTHTHTSRSTRTARWRGARLPLARRVDYQAVSGTRGLAPSSDAPAVWSGGVLPLRSERATVGYSVTQF